MKQIELKALLEEASNPECTWQRRGEIQCKLGEATIAMNRNGTYEAKGRKAGLLLLIDSLYVNTIQNRPELLTTLFPVFALICGVRKEGFLIADIDWSIVD